MTPLISADSLSERLEDFHVVDVRAEGDYQKAHIPSAQALCFEALSSPPTRDSGARRPLPTPVEFAESMARSGVGDESRVVVYDDVRGSRAARLWWMLDSLGVSCRVLDGGFASWTATCESGLSTPNSHQAFTPRPWPSTHFIELDELGEISDKTLILDARTSGRFHGEASPLDPAPGHIPNARSAPWTENCREDGRFVSVAKLRKRFALLGVQTGSRPLLYCGSGVTACHNALALRLLGVRARVYVGSWSEWASDASRPIES